MTELKEEFGMKKLEGELLERLKDIHPTFRRGFWIAHRDLDKIIDKDFFIVSGRGPSASVHLVHLIIFDVIKNFQEKLEVNVFIPFSNDEKFLFGKIDSLEESERYAIENAKDILALGFSKEKTYILIDTMQMHPKFYKFVVRIAKKITSSTVKDIFGLKDENNIGAFFYPAIQAAHILYPSLKFGKPVLVPIGLDQDPHMLLARDIAEKLDLPKPASIYFKTIPGLKGREKMSASDPYSAIYIDDSKKMIKRKIWMTFTGGQPTIEEQRKYGGDPSRCIVFEYIKLLESDDNKVKTIEEECKKGLRMCGECKNYLFELVTKFFEKIKNKRDDIKLEEYKVLK